MKMYFWACYLMVILWVCYGYPMVRIANRPTVLTTLDSLLKKIALRGDFFAYVKKKQYLCRQN